MPKSNPTEEKNIRFIAVIEDLFEVYIHTQKDYDELEKKIKDLLDNVAPKNKIEEKLIAFYQQEFTYLKNLKFYAQKTKKSIGQLDEQNILPSERSLIITAIEKTGILNRKSYASDTIHKYVVARHQFIFGGDLPLFITKPDENNSIVPLLKELANKDFSPAGYLLGCHLKENPKKNWKEKDSVKYLGRALSHNYPLANLFIAKKYLNFILALANKEQPTLELPVENIDLNGIIVIMRTHIAFNFTSAIIFYESLLQKLSDSVPLIEDKKFTEDQQSDLVALAQILDRIATGKETSVLQSFREIPRFISNRGPHIKHFLLASVQKEFNYLSIGRSNHILDEIISFQSVLCQYIRKQISIESTSHNFFKTIISNETFFDKLMRYTKSQANLTKTTILPEYIVNILELPYLRVALSLLVSLTNLSELINRSFNASHDNGGTKDSTKEILSSADAYIEGVIAIIYNHKTTLLSLSESPAELQQLIQTHLKIFIGYIEKENSNQDLRHRCFSAFLNLSNITDNVYQMYANALCQLLAKGVEGTLSNDILYQQLNVLIQYFCIKKGIPFENYHRFTDENPILQTLSSIIKEKKNPSGKPTDKNSEISSQIKGTLDIMEILAKQTCNSEELEAILEGENLMLEELGEVNNTSEKLVSSKPEKVEKLPLKDALPYEQLLRNIYNEYNDFKCADVLVYQKIVVLTIIRQLELRFSQKASQDDLIFPLLQELEKSLEKILIPSDTKQQQLANAEDKQSNREFSIN